MVSNTFLNRKDFRFSSLGSSFGASAFLIGASPYNESTNSFKGIVKIIVTAERGGWLYTTIKSLHQVAADPTRNESPGRLRYSGAYHTWRRNRDACFRCSEYRAGRGMARASGWLGTTTTTTVFMDKKIDRSGHIKSTTPHGQ